MYVIVLAASSGADNERVTCTVAVRVQITRTVFSRSGANTFVHYFKQNLIIRTAPPHPGTLLAITVPNASPVIMSDRNSRVCGDQNLRPVE